MTTKHGVTGIFESIGLVETDSPAPEPQEPVEAPPAPTPKTVAGPSVYWPPTAPAVLSADDQATLKALETQVYAVPSSYTVFQRVRASLPTTMSIADVFKVMDAANPGVTPAKVIADIETHLGIIQTKRRDFDAKIAQARAEKVDAPVKQMNDIQAQIEAAQQQITAWTRQLTDLHKTADDANTAISAGATRFTAIEAQLSAPLLEAKRVLGGM